MRDLRFICRGHIRQFVSKNKNKTRMLFADAISQNNRMVTANA